MWNSNGIGSPVYIKMKYSTEASFAKKADREDPLADCRKLFHFPKHSSKQLIYLVGNSLGLQPKTTRKFIDAELQDWANLGIEGHLKARKPWLYYHKFSKKSLGKILGAKPSEVVAMNTLTVNLHLLMVSFYRPSKTRFKIIMEAGAFSSDQYAVESQVRLHGLSPAETIVELKPEPGEFVLRTEKIIQAIKEHGDTIALVLMPGVQYYTGQVFDIAKITAAGHAVGAYVGLDLAHAAGNVPVNLHKNEVDFAVWCSYKYLNSGPGGIAGAFVHEKHHQTEFLRLAGWWGHQENIRFKMEKGFIPMGGVDSWQLSNVPVLQGASHLAALEIFEEVGINALRKKSIQLTGYLIYLLKNVSGASAYRIITPEKAADRGCQVSIYFPENGPEIFKKITALGIAADWREPGVIRVAPTPLYNSFLDIYKFVSILTKVITTT